jgi:hypothetical protein
MLIATSLKKDLANMIIRLQGHAKHADSTAMATELRKEAEFREGIGSNPYFLMVCLTMM